jgi:Zn-dependent protease
MARGTLIGRLFGTDIYATGTFLMLIVFMLVLNAEVLYAVAAWEVALILSVLVHEFGHVFAVRRFTGKPSVIVLWGLGGLCIHEPTPVIRKRIAISLMGPAFGLLLGGACWATARYWIPDSAHVVVRVFFHAMIIINIYYTLLNLLPVLPMDGGQATLAALEAKLPRAKALALTRKISVAFAGAGLAVAAYAFPDHVFLILILALFLVQNLVASRHGL